MADYGEAKPAPETLSMLLGKYLGEGAEAVGSLFPPSNPYGQAVKNLLLGDVPETARRLEEGEPYVLMDTRAGRQLIKPEALEVAGFVPVGEVAKGAGLAAKGLPVLHAIGAIKAPGGNWLQDQLDRALFEMKGEVLDPELKPHQIVSDWVDQKLKKYIRNEMGTEQDPLRQLAERGITFMDPLEETGRSSLQRYIPVFRKGEGFPPEGYGKSELAKDWELITDSRIGIDKAGDLIGLPSMDPSKKEASEIAELVNHYGGEEQALDVLHRTLVDMRARFPHAHKAAQGVVENKIDAIKSGEYKNAMMENEYPWLTKVPPETRVYYPSSGRTLLEDTGLKNLTQSLAKYGLMEDLRRKGEFEMPELAFKYEDLAKMTVPQTVEKMNELRAIEDQLKIKRSLAAANNAATVPVKEYPDSGFKWVQYRVPEGENSEELLQKALGAEGEMMKHCVGSYCREVTAGAKNIYSLRDPKGQPHVTIEVVPDPQGKSAPSIQQIKGATNAPPHERYIPYVQDFIKSMGDWKKIDDLRNAKMFQVREGNLWPNREPMPPGYYTIDEIKELSKQQNMPEDQLSDFFKELEAMVRSRHYAEGGAVQTQDYDPAKVDALVSKVLTMKEGGDVAAQAREKAAAAWEGLKQMYEEAKDKAASENVLEGLKGTARAYTTDVLGVPADLLASFPVAPRESGNPYANAIRDLQEKVGDVAGSDWLAQKLGLYGEGLAHEAGRMFGPGAVKTLDPKVLELITYHGTPHRFPATERNPLGEFDASKIGTGEGAQAYGHGIYLAESPGVAGGYRDKLAKNEVLLDGEKVKHDFNATDPQSLGLAALTSEPSPAGAAKALRDAVADPSLWGKGSAYEADLAKQYLAAADWLEKNEKRLKVDSGSFYKVDLPDEMVDRMLDWDKPISEQPYVKKALEAYIRKDASKEMEEAARDAAAARLDDELGKRGIVNSPESMSDDWMSLLFGQRPNQKAVDAVFEELKKQELENLDPMKFLSAAQRYYIPPHVNVDSMTGKQLYVDLIARDPIKSASLLREMGIPGNKYLDELSRARGEGTRNFVIFPGEEKNLNILERKARGGAVDYDPEKIARLMAKVLE